MKDTRPGIPSRTGVAACAVAAAILAASCASGPRFGVDAAPERFLPAVADAYVKADRPMLALLAPAFLSGKDLKQLDSFITMTESALAGISLPPGASRTGDPASGPASRPGTGIVEGPIAFAGIATGSWPAPKAAALLRLAGWKYRDKVWSAPGRGLFVAVADGGRVLFGTAAPDTRTPAAERRDPVPEHVSMAEASVAVWVDDPLGILAASMAPGTDSGEAIVPDIPLKDAWFRADPPVDGRYASSLGFTFAAPRDAIVYSMVCKFAFMSIAARAWPEDRETALQGLRWKAEGSRLIATGMSLEAKDIAALFLSLLPAPGVAGAFPPP